MSYDEASFDFPLLSIIWRDVRCLFTGKHNIEWNHIKGRGGKRFRKIHSSPFNASPIIHEVHEWGAIHQPEIEEFFLRKANEAVLAACVRGDYTLTEEDRQFRLKYKL